MPLLDRADKLDNRQERDVETLSQPDFTRSTRSRRIQRRRIFTLRDQHALDVNVLDEGSFSEQRGRTKHWYHLRKRKEKSQKPPGEKSRGPPSSSSSETNSPDQVEPTSAISDQSTNSTETRQYPTPMGSGSSYSPPMDPMPTGVYPSDTEMSTTVLSTTTASTCQECIPLLKLPLSTSGSTSTEFTSATSIPDSPSLTTTTSIFTTDTVSPTSSTSSSGGGAASNALVSKGLPAGAIAGIVIGSLLVIGILLIALVFFMRHKRKSHMAPSQEFLIAYPEAAGFRNRSATPGDLGMGSNSPFQRVGTMDSDEVSNSFHQNFTFPTTEKFPYG